MDFKLSAEQQDIQQMVLKFGKEVIAPEIDELDEKGQFPRHFFTKLAELGLTGLLFPEELGGANAGRLTTALVCEAIAQTDMATATWLSVHNMVASLIYRFGNSEQHQRWLPHMAAGEMLGAISLSEANAGSDPASLQTTAVRDGDSYVLNGQKMWVTSGGVADVYAVFVRTDPTNDSKGISCFIVEKGTPGFSFGKYERKMGLRSSPTAELIFEDCRISVNNLIGEEGQGLRIALSALDGGRVNIGAISVGVAQACLDIATEYAKQRQQFQKHIGSFQGIQFMLADMAIRTQASRLMIYEAAQTMDTEGQATTKAAMAKCFASDQAMQTTLDAIQILGGAGYVRDFPVERHARDVKAAQIFEGTNQIQRVIIARKLLGDVAR